MNRGIDSGPSKLDVEITASMSEEQLKQLLQIITQRVGELCAGPKAEVARHGRPGEKLVTFSIPGPTEFELEWARDWLNELLIDGRREVTGTINPM